MVQCLKFRVQRLGLRVEGEPSRPTRRRGGGGARSNGEHGVVGFAGKGGVRERKRDNRLRALGATRPHTVGYIGECDQEQGEIESSWLER